jgi:NAD(P)-dependent dehydrogenase (short-subunit alcohol dehydrogenase family)
MLLANKTAVVYGAGGTIGGAVAEAFAAEGARLYLAGRTLATVEAVSRQRLLWRLHVLAVRGWPAVRGGNGQRPIPDSGQSLRTRRGYS